MRLQDYIDTVVSNVRDEELRSRIQEELADHWEDYCERQSMTDTPKRVFGNEAILAYHTNAVASPGMFGKDVILSVVCGVFTLVSFLLFSSFLTPDLENVSGTDKLFTVAVSVVGIGFWGSVAWCVYLAFQRRLLARYGQSGRRTVLLALAVVAPCAVVGTESLLSSMNAFAAGAPFSISWQIISSLLALAALCGSFLSAGWMTYHRTSESDRILAGLRWRLPISVMAVVFAGVTILLAAQNVSGSNYDLLVVAGMPFVLPLLILYLAWGLVTGVIGLLFHAIGFPVIFAYWVTVASALLIGAGIPLVRLVFRMPTPLVLRLTASIVIPLAFILPMVPHDIPNVTWNAPVVWSWDALERKQLNVVYPWAATLMRRDDGVNIGYGAYLIDGKITVAQGGGSSYMVTSHGTKSIQTAPGIEDLMQSGGNGLYGEIPSGFACDEKPIEEFLDTHDGTTSAFGMFGMRCEILSYREEQVAIIGHGSLIDLDVSDDGLLAVSINMGSYDPTYVYVVEISEREN